MKNVQRYLPFLLLGLSPFFSCKNKCNTEGFGIQSIQPDANPVGYEIFIACEGVSASTRVRFDEVEAASVRTTEGGLIAKIPAGLVGNVFLSIEEGDCNDSKPFYVLDVYPTNVPQSPTLFIIPQPPGSYPGSIDNNWRNLYDNSYRLMLVSDYSNPGHLLAGDGNPEHGGSLENPSNNDVDFFENNPVSGTWDTLENKIFMVIDRSHKTGGYRDTLNGSFIPGMPPQETRPTMLLTSERTGRQLVLYKQ